MINSNLIERSLISLKNKNIPNAEIDLRILLKQASYVKQDIILSNINMNNVNINLFNSLLTKRLNRQPISKIINKKNFWKYEFFVNSDVLDPRPESELIIEEVLSNLGNINKNKIKILDIGTGSGCLAISLSKEINNSTVTAIDISKKALKVAKKNIEIFNLEKKIKLKLCDFRDINEKFDIIVSNPPYIKETDYNNLQIEIKNFEPKVALLGGKDGLRFYKLFANSIDKIMKKNSIFICEIGYDQFSNCKKIFDKSNLKLNKITKDIQNINRTLTFSKI